MDTAPAFGFEDLLTSAIGEMAKAICVRQGEGEERQFTRSQAAVHMIMGFMPRDVIEVMLAGHCMMLHEVMTASVSDTLRGEAASAGGGPRSNLVALNKAFNDNLDRLERYRLRPAEGRREDLQVSAEQPAHIATEVVEPSAPSPAAQQTAPMLNRAARRQAARTERRADATSFRAELNHVVPVRTAQADQVAIHTEPDPLLPHPAEAAVPYRPSPEAITACQANPEAMAALEAGDAAGFARALGIDTPSEAFLEAANRPGSPFDPGSPGPWPPVVVTGMPKV